MLDAAPAPSLGDERRALLDLLQSAVSELVVSPSATRLASAVGETARAGIAASAVIVALYDRRRGSLRAVYADGVPAGRWEGRTVTANAAAEAGLFALPLGDPEQCVGVLFLGPMRTRRLSDAELAFLRVLGVLVAMAVDRLQLAAARLHDRPELPPSDQPPVAPGLRVGDLEIDLGGHRISVAGRQVRLTPSEMRVLVLLAEEPGRVRSRAEILRQLGQPQPAGDGRACDVHISNLRRKIEPDPAAARRLVTVRGVGYALRAR